MIIRCSSNGKGDISGGSGNHGNRGSNCSSRRVRSDVKDCR